METILLVYEQVPEELNIFLIQAEGKISNLIKDAQGTWVNSDELTPEQDKAHAYINASISEFKKKGKAGWKELSRDLEPFKLPANVTLVQCGFIL